ncbi:MAG: hypothetical protein RLP44_10520 [Aggregatilineales bacterium]
MRQLFLSTLVLLLNFNLYAQETPIIEFSCPSVSTQNRLPATATEDVFYIDDDDENLILYRGSTEGITETQLPIDGGALEYKLSPSGDYLAILTLDSNVNLLIFDISEGLIQDYVTTVEITSVFRLVWLDDNNIRINESTSTARIKSHTLNIETGDIIVSLVDLSSIIETDNLNYVYSPDMRYLGFFSQSHFNVATVSDNNIVYATDIFDYYNTLSSTVWSPSSREVLIYTSEWLILDLNSQETEPLPTVPNYDFSYPIWSPDSESIAFLGTRLPRERPNVLSDLILYKRSQNTLVDLCQSGMFFINGVQNDVDWSSDGRWLAYIMETLEGLNLYAIDLNNNIIATIELRSTGSVPRLLGWR